MFDRFKHQKAASKVFTVEKEDDDGNSSDTISWCGSAPSSPKSPKPLPVTTIPETPPQNLCRVSHSGAERRQPCAAAAALSPNPGSFGLRNISVNSAKRLLGVAGPNSPGSDNDIGENLVQKYNMDSDTDEELGDNGVETVQVKQTEPSCYVMQLVEMFPDADQQHLQAVLDSCDGDMEAAVQKLLSGEG